MAFIGDTFVFEIRLIKKLYQDLDLLANILVIGFQKSGLSVIVYRPDPYKSVFTWKEHIASLATKF